jgi:hypothetical protein
MKNLILIILLALSITVSRAQPVSVGQMKAIVKSPRATWAQVDEVQVYCTKQSYRKDLNVGQEKELLELFVLTHKKDRNDSAYFWTLRQQRTNPDAFESALSALSPADQEEIHRYLKIALDMEQYGTDPSGKN